MKQKNIKQAVIIGRRWFDKVNGNTYHTTTVYVDGVTLESVRTYGYGDSYRQTAQELLKTNGYNVPEGYGDFIRAKNFTFDVSDVSRKKDL